MYIADYTNHNILKVDMSTKQLSVFAHEALMNQPNDIAIDSKDRLYASDPNWKAGTGRIWTIGTEGKVTLLEDNMGTANGIEVSSDDKTLYVNESVQRKVWAYDLSPAGQIRNKRLLIQFPDFGMDGMRCDTKGNLYICRHGKGTVAKVSPEGKLLTEITLLGKQPSNIAFGGKDGRTAYVTLQDQGNIESFRVDIPGREWEMTKNR
ncbi:MAG: SMP-30/gluconolactonase/LRE family protein [Segetibacter sp.]